MNFKAAHQSGEPPFSLLTAYQLLTLLNPKLRFHFLNQRLKLDLALFLAIGVDIPCDTLSVDRRGISPFPYILTDLVYRASSALAILGLVGLKIHRFRLVRIVRGFLSRCFHRHRRRQKRSHLRQKPLAVPNDVFDLGFLFDGR